MVTIDGKEIVQVIGIRIDLESETITIEVWHDQRLSKINNLKELGYKYKIHKDPSHIDYANIILPLKTEVHFKSVEANDDKSE